MIQTIKEAIEYMETHLHDEIDVVDVAKHVYVSPFHLQKIFKAITQISMSEYIRNRRLSLAGIDVMNSDETILTIALRYGYDSQEGFQKAFYRFHGVNPFKARQQSAVLKTFHPLKIHIQFKGGLNMDYRIVKQEAFRLMGVKRSFSNTIIEDDSNTEIPDFWNEKLQDGTVKKLLSYSADQVMYSPCGAVSKDVDYFYYGIAVMYDEKAEVGLDIWELTHPLYAVFVCKTKEEMGSTWEKIVQDFIPNSPYEIADQPDFEKYPNHDDYFCEIWVPIK